MKQAKLKSIFIITLLTILSAILIIAGPTQDTPDSTDITLTLPVDNAYELNDSAIFTVTFLCNGSGVPDWNITAINFWSNVNGTWEIHEHWNQNGEASLNDTAVGHQFNLSGINDRLNGTGYDWNCQFNYTNATGATNDNADMVSVFAANSTLYVEYPPRVTLFTLADNYWTNATKHTLTYNVTTEYTSMSNFDCNLYTNESGSWTSTTYDNGVNFTGNSFTNYFEEGNILWNIRCAESGNPDVFSFADTNRTIYVDRTVPAISSILMNRTAAANGNTYNSVNLEVNFTITEKNPLNCKVYINDTLNNTDTNANTTVKNFTVKTITDGVWSVSLGCEDKAGLITNSTSYTFTIDTDAPDIENIKNGTISGFKDRWAINFTTDEPVNYTIKYNSISTALTLSLSNSSFGNDTHAVLTGLTDNTQYYYNISVCDAVGNCNNTADVSKTTGTSLAQFEFKYPFAITAGWSFFGIYDTNISFSQLFIDTEAEYVYYWNKTGQEWIYATLGGTADQGFSVGVLQGTKEDGIGREVVAMYKSANGTWKNRNVSVNTSTINYSFTSGHNFVRMEKNRTMGELAKSLLNGTAASCAYGNVTLCTTEEGVTYNMTQFYFSAYNNTGVTWDINYVYNWTWNNNTKIGNLTSHEVAWIYSPKNLTWDRSKIIANWTI